MPLTSSLKQKLCRPLSDALGWTLSPVADKISEMFLEEKTAEAVTVREAEGIARELYGVETTTTALPGEYDCNFHLQARDGRDFVLKCMHPARETAFIDMQCSALAHLLNHATHLPLPRLQPTTKGDAYTSWKDAAGHRAARARGIASPTIERT